MMVWGVEVCAMCGGVCCDATVQCLLQSLKRGNSHWN